MNKIAYRLIAPFFVFLAALTLTGCAASRPKTFVTTANESGIWKAIEVREGAQRGVLWSTVVDALSSKFDLEVLDKESGYVRTGWNNTIASSGKNSQRYRARIITKFNSDFTVLQVKSEANWLDDGVWVNGYDTRVLEDVYGDLQGRIGRVRR